MTLAQVASGNRASALLTGARCRCLLLADLGITPSLALQALHLGPARDTQPPLQPCSLAELHP